MKKDEPVAVNIVMKITTVGWKAWWGTYKQTLPEILAHGTKIKSEEIARFYFPFIPTDLEYNR